MALEILVNIGSGNGMMPDGMMPLPIPMLTYWQFDMKEQTFVCAKGHKNIPPPPPPPGPYTSLQHMNWQYTSSSDW